MEIVSLCIAKGDKMQNEMYDWKNFFAMHDNLISIQYYWLAGCIRVFSFNVKLILFWKHFLSVFLIQASSGLVQFLFIGVLSFNKCHMSNLNKIPNANPTEKLGFFSRRI